MNDPEELLRDDARVSPPPEIVLAAVRVFRYRLLAVVAAIALVAVLGATFLTKLAENGRFLVEVAEAQYDGGIVCCPVGIGIPHEDGDVTLMVWEVVSSDLGDDRAPLYVHVIGWDERARPLILDMDDPRIDGEPAREIGLEGSPGAGTDRTLFDLWFSVDAPIDARTLTFDAVVTRVNANPTPVVTMPFAIELRSEG